jgi:hypothetical protein
MEEREGGREAGRKGRQEGEGMGHANETHQPT